MDYIYIHTYTLTQLTSDHIQNPELVEWQDVTVVFLQT